jgi:hypothetical protein
MATCRGLSEGHLGSGGLDLRLFVGVDPAVRLTLRETTLTAEQREKARLRSERRRRAHGIMPRKPAQRPWLAMGISRSTYYRRRAKARQDVNFAVSVNRANYLADRLTADLARCVIANAAMARELGNSLGTSCRF